MAASSLKLLRFVGGSLEDLRGFPADVRQSLSIELMRVQSHLEPTDFKPMPAVGSGAYEIRVHPARISHRAVRFTTEIMKRTTSKAKPKCDVAESITASSSNVFVDLGFDEAEARVIQMRTEVMLRIEAELKAQGWTQAHAAERLGITQPRVSKLKKGIWQDFSLDMLLTLAGRAGLRPQLKLGR